MTLEPALHYSHRWHSLLLTHSLYDNTEPKLRTSLLLILFFSSFLFDMA